MPEESRGSGLQRLTAFLRGLFRSPFFRMVQAFALSFLGLYVLGQGMKQDSSRLTLLSLVLFAYAAALFWCVLRTGLFRR
ncbi:MAG: hypothetical protein R6V03_03895 [Kiritimatiellia bacterium]